MPEDLKNITLKFEPSPHFLNIFEFHKLTKINFPFKRNELNDTEWEDLAEFNHQIELRKVNGL